NFVRSLIATRVAYFFTPRVLLQTLVQYSNQARVWTANARFGWLSTAGTGLFVVFNEGREADGFFQWNQPQARSLIVKYARQFGRSGWGDVSFPGRSGTDGAVPSREPSAR